MAKGAGMIAPNMATMLVRAHDRRAGVDRRRSRRRSADAVAGTFNALIVDGCTSTNDTVIVLASGDGRCAEPRRADRGPGRRLRRPRRAARRRRGGCDQGREIRVAGAASDADARLAGRAVAGSLLVKISLYGADPYWGRIVSELGASGAAFDLDRVARRLRRDDGLSRRRRRRPRRRAAVSRTFGASDVEIYCDLGLGSGTASVLTTDLGHGYIDENMRTS